MSVALGTVKDNASCAGLVLEDSCPEDCPVVHVLVEHVQVSGVAFPDALDEVIYCFGVLLDELFEFGVIEVLGVILFFCSGDDAFFFCEGDYFCGDVEVVDGGGDRVVIDAVQGLLPVPAQVGQTGEYVISGPEVFGVEELDEVRCPVVVLGYEFCCGGVEVSLGVLGDEGWLLVVEVDR